jgi:ribosome-binding protein aMBF1 (putative translation factor)
METKPRKWRVSVLAEKIGVSRDTLDKARRRGTTSTKTAKKLEQITGVGRLKFLYPEEYGDPWLDIIDYRIK